MAAMEPPQSADRTVLTPQRAAAAGTRRVTLGGLAVAVVATVAAFPFEPAGAHEWTGLFFIVGALALMTATMLLGATAVQAGNVLAAAGFGAVALYGFGTTLDSSLLARGLPDVSVGLLPAMWAVLALGLLLVGLSGWFPGWVRTVGLLSAAGHALVAVTVRFGAEMPPTGADPSAWQPLLVAASKVLFLVALSGWGITVWKGRTVRTRTPRAPPPSGWGRRRAATQRRSVPYTGLMTVLAVNVAAARQTGARNRGQGTIRAAIGPAVRYPESLSPSAPGAPPPPAR